MFELQHDFALIRGFGEDIGTANDVSFHEFRNVLRRARDLRPINPTVFELLKKYTKRLPERPIEGSDPVVLEPGSPHLPSTPIANAAALAQEEEAALGKIARRVCRVAVGPNGPPGTGFLIGSDLVLTAAHVLRGVDLALVRVQFDFIVWSEDNEEDHFEVALDHSAGSPSFVALQAGPTGTAAPNPDQLDFAVVRLNTPVGAMPYPRGEEVRGWFDLTGARLPEVGERAIIVQHPTGGPIRAFSGKVTALTTENTRMLYAVTTFVGASGAPIIGSDHRLLGIHVAGDRDELDQDDHNEGVVYAAAEELLIPQLTAKGFALGPFPQA